MNKNERYSLHTITRANGIVECDKHKVPLKSPVRSDKDPLWIIDLHARERNGEPFVCADIHASLDEIAKVLALWILPTFKRMGISPTVFLRHMATAVETIEKTGGIKHEAAAFAESLNVKINRTKNTFHKIKATNSK